METITAKRCLDLSHEEEDPAKILKNGALCLLQTQRNATIVVEKFLDLKIENVTFILRCRLLYSLNHRKTTRTSLS